METATETSNIKVEFLDGTEKSTQELEREVLQMPEKEEPIIEVTTAELKDEDVLGYLGKKMNREISSFDDLFVEKIVEKDVELPEDVNAFYKFKKETGRGIDDFVKINRDFDSEDPENILRDYYLTKEDGYDKEDIETLMQDFRHESIDEDIDTEEEIKMKNDRNKKKDLSKKKAINEAKKFFNSQKEQYKMPLESSMASLSDEDKDLFEEYKQYTKRAKDDEVVTRKANEVFTSKTNELFNENFKGFEFKIDNDKTLMFSPADAAELKQANSTPLNLIGKFLNKDGFIEDAVGYHRALTVASYADRFVKLAYEQGKADMAEEAIKNEKNINMTVRKSPDFASKTGTQVEFLNHGGDKPFKVKLPSYK